MTGDETSWRRLVSMTPQWARELINDPGRPPGRSVKPDVLNSIAADMRSGAWQPTPENGIQLLPDGTLLAGQHTALAVILVDRTIPVMVYQEPSSDEPDDPDQVLTIRAKWRMDGARSLAEAAVMMRSFAMELQGLHDQGWILQGPVEDDYGYCSRPELGRKL